MGFVVAYIIIGIAIDTFMVSNASDASGMTIAKHIMFVILWPIVLLVAIFNR